MTSDISTIMFDLGNVIINFDHNLAVNRIKNHTNISAEEIYQLFFDSGITKLFEEGKISPREFYLKVKDMLGLKISYDEFLPIWNEIFFLNNDNLLVHKLVKKLKSKFNLILISNINKLHYNYLNIKYDILKEFDNKILSYEVGACKPDTLIYQKALNLIGIDSSGAIYIDDRADLIKKSAELGIKSICFKNYKLLLKNLIFFGLKVT